MATTATEFRDQANGMFPIENEPSTTTTPTPETIIAFNNVAPHSNGNTTKTAASPIANTTPTIDINNDDDALILTPTASVTSADISDISPSEAMGSDFGSGFSIATTANGSSCSISDLDLSMPQWKKELIQRRKTNVARTIGANQTGTCPKKATNPSVAATSPVISMVKNFCNDSSSIKSTTISSHSGVNARTPDIIQPSGSASSGHYTPVNGSCQQQQPPMLACVVNSSPATLSNGKPKTAGAIGITGLNTFTGNDGVINNSCTSGGTTSGTCLKTSQQQNPPALFRHSQQPDFIVGQQFQLHSRLDTERCIEPSESCAIAAGTSFIKNPTVNKLNNKLNKYKSNNSGKSTVTAGSNVNSVAPNVNSNKKMVAAQELNDTANDAFDFDPSEELQYGPGIVSKLRCRYLSLALRQSAGKHRSNLDNLRRATSLNNLLDDDDRASNSSCMADHSSNTARPNSDLVKTPDEFVATYQKNLKISDKQRSRHVMRGNESMKRARSVEALLVCDKSWDTGATESNGVVQMRYHQRIEDNKSDTTSITSAADVTIEDKITSVRERNSLNEKPPKRLSPFMDETERPPPDVVKQTLKIFEATANRRGRGLTRNNFSGEVATKVANYKSIISQEKPPIIYPKPPLSPKKNFRKPTNLDIVAAKKFNNQQQQQIITNSKKPHPASPVTNASKKFTSTEAVTNDLNDKQLLQSVVQSPSLPVPSLRTDLTLRHTPRNESTPIIRSSTDGHSPRTPDILPRKIFDTSSNLVDSPVAQLTKQVERLTIESPIVVSSNNIKRNSSESDDSLDGSEIRTKRVSKLALENISKAGTTQQFSFNNKTNNKLPFASATINGNNLTATVADQPQLTTTTSKQVGIIRPLIAEPKLFQTEKLKQNATVASADYASLDELTARARDNLVISNLSQQSSNNTNNFSTNSSNCNSSSNNSSKTCLQSAVVDEQQRPVLTSREIEKNLINAKKSEEANLEANGSKWQFTKKKPRNPQQQQQQTPQNTMVFNFKDRKEVPDYIENDGLLFKRKRELPKPNESGFVLLGDLSLETSTDPEDDWTLGPPSPCDVEFENANIIIDGKSSIRYKSKDISLKVQFDDTLTSTFEYPSESSLFEESVDNANTDNVDHVHTAEEIVKNPSQKSLGNMSLGSAPLGSYTPMKAQINTDFELGVTRAPALNPSETTTSDELLKNNLNSNGNTSDHETDKTTTTNTAYNSNGINHILNGSGGSDEPESLQYLKPATDDLTVVYSEGTQKTDLLY